MFRIQSIFAVILIYLSFGSNSKGFIIPTTASSLTSISNTFLNWTSTSCLLHVIGESNRMETNFDNHKTMVLKYHHPVVLLGCSGDFSCSKSSLTTDKFIKYYHTRLSSSTCTISTFLLGTKNMDGNTSISESHLIGALQYMESTVYLDENPRYGILMFEKLPTESEDKIVSAFFSSLEKIHTNTKYFVSFEDPSLSPSLANQIICLHCPYNSEIIYPTVNINDLNEVNRVWMNIHKNLSGTRIVVKRTDLKHYASGGRTNCNSLGIDFRGTQRLCVVNLLSSYLNFEIELIHHSSWINASTSFHHHLTKIKSVKVPILRVVSNNLDNYQAILLYRDSRKSDMAGQRIEWVPHGWVNDPLKFILLLDKASLNFSALYKPYDAFTWFLTCVSLLFVGAVLSVSLWAHNRNEYYYNVNETHKKSRTDFVKILLMSLGSIIEQNPTDKTARKMIHSFRILFGVWLLVSIVISNGYTGIVISFLCSSSLPSDLPLSLKDVVDNEYPMISTDVIYLEDYKINYPLTKGVFFEYFANTASTIRKKHYDIVENKTTCLVNIPREKLMFIYESKLSIPKSNTWGSVKDVIIPKDFAYVSFQRYVSRIYEIVKLNPKVMAWSPPSKEAISLTLAYTSPRNYFSIIFKKYSCFLHEAGFPAIWEEQEQDFHRRLDIKKYACWKNVKDSIWDKPNCSTAAVEYEYYQPSKIFTYEEDETKPLPMETLWTTFHLEIFGMIIATLGFLLELVLMELDRCRNYIMKKKTKTKNRKYGKDIKIENSLVLFEVDSYPVDKPRLRQQEQLMHDNDSFSILPGALY